jgi:hypothetical protein
MTARCHAHDVSAERAERKTVAESAGWAPSAHTHTQVDELNAQRKKDRDDMHQEWRDNDAEYAEWQRR